MHPRFVALLLAAAALVLTGCETPPPPPTTTTTTVKPGVVRDMTFPVVGKVNFADTFGAPRSGVAPTRAPTSWAPRC